MVIGVLLQIVNLCLTHITHVSHAQSSVAEREVEGEELAGQFYKCFSIRLRILASEQRCYIFS